jgi:dienelactone hydrolase
MSENTGCRRFLLALAGVMLLTSACPEVPSSNPSIPAVASFDPAPVSPDPEHLVFPAVPQPSDLLIDPGTGRVNLPVQVALTVLNQDAPVVVDAFKTLAASQLVESYMNTLSGFTVDGAVTTSIDGRGATIDAASITADSVYVLDLTGPLSMDECQAVLCPSAAVLRMDKAVVNWEPAEESTVGILTLSPAPDQLWQQDHTYVAVVTTDISDVSGRAIASSYIFNLLKSTAPLAEETGRSTCALPDVQAAQLEAMRAGLFEPVFLYLESDEAGAEQLQRSEVAILWPFTIRPGAIALNDPITNEIPIPNDVLMTTPFGSKHDCDNDGSADCQSGSLCFPIACDTDSPAQKGLLQYLNTLDGWPVSLGIRAAFSRPVEAASATTDSAFLYQLPESGDPIPLEITLSLSETGTELSVHPHEGLIPGGKYAGLLTTGMQTAGDLPYPVRPSTITAITKLTEKVFVKGKSQLTDFAVGDSDALLLEVMRSTLQPLIARLGLDDERLTIASLWSFQIQSSNEALFSLASNVVPFPSDLFMIDNDMNQPVQVELPLSPNLSVLEQTLREDVNALDGFSSVAGTTAPFLIPLSPDSMQWMDDISEVESDGPGETISLAMADITGVDFRPGKADLKKLEDPANIYGTGEVQTSFSNRQLNIRPEAGSPLPAGHRFVVLAFDNLFSEATDTDGGNLPVKASPLFHLARSSHSVLDADTATSLVSLVTDSDAARLEAVRTQYDALFTALESEVAGLSRDRVVMAWTYTTQTVGSWLLPIAKELATLTTGVVSKPGTIQDAEEVPFNLPHAGKIIMDGRFPGQTALSQAKPGADPPDMGRMNFDSKGRPDWQPAELPYLLALPKEGALVSGPFPVVIMLHGQGGSGDQVLTQADNFLAAGYAVIAPDLLFHGARALLDEASGIGFFNSDLMSTRDHLLQSSLEVLQLVRFITAKEGLGTWLEENLDGANPLKTNELYLVASSTGALAGAVALALSDNFEAAALVSPAGHLAQVLTDSESNALQAVLSEPAEALGIAADSAEYQRIADLAQILLDRVDPINYARYWQATLPDSQMSTPVFVLGTEKDSVFPPDTARQLACAARGDEAPASKTYTGACHNFLFAPCGGGGMSGQAAIAVQDILLFFDNSGDPTGIAGVETGDELLCGTVAQGGAQ